MFDEKYSHSLETEVGGNNMMLSRISANRSDVRFREVAHDRWIRLSRFANAVSHVLSLGCQETDDQDLRTPVYRSDEAHSGHLRSRRASISMRLDERKDLGPILGAVCGCNTGSGHSRCY